MNGPGPLFVDAETLGRLLGGVSAYTVKAWARRTVDGLPSYRAGKRVVFDPDEALAWFKAHQRRQSALPLPRRRVRTREEARR